MSGAAPRTRASQGVDLAGERRWDSLDSLRGIAAFLVLCFHCAQAAPGFAERQDPLSLSAWLNAWTWLKYSPLRALVSSGPSAVVLFFALSGFVLSLPFLRAGGPPGYGGFALKRLCRIYPPFAAAILGVVVIYALAGVSQDAGMGGWFNEAVPAASISFGLVLQTLAMTGLKQYMQLDSVMWSLVHELRISLLFPLLFLAVMRWPKASLAASLLGSVACTMALGGADPETVAMSFVDTGRFVFLFVAGILIAARTAEVRRMVGRLGPLATLALWAGAFVLLLSPGPTLYTYYNMAWGLGATLLLALTVGSASAERALAAAPLVWLGRVSYSLYLVHVPILLVTLYVTGGEWPLPATFLVVAAVSLLCAEAMYRAVEVPSIRLGRSLARWADGWRVARRSAGLGAADGSRP